MGAVTTDLGAGLLWTRALLEIGEQLIDLMDEDISHRPHHFVSLPLQNSAYAVERGLQELRRLLLELGHGWLQRTPELLLPTGHQRIGKSAH